MTAYVKFCFRIANGGIADEVCGVSPISISMHDWSLLPAGRPLLWLLTISSTK